MSTDLYAYVEYREHPSDEWKLATADDLSASLSGYRLYAALAGVRIDTDIKPLIPPRGFPQDASKALFGRYYWHVVDRPEDSVLPHSCTPREAERYSVQPNVTSKQLGVHDFISDPDFFAASWMTPSEIRDSVRHFQLDPDDYSASLTVVLGVADLIQSAFGDGTARTVIWFA